MNCFIQIGNFSYKHVHLVLVVDGDYWNSMDLLWSRPETTWENEIKFKFGTDVEIQPELIPTLKAFKEHLNAYKKYLINL